MPERRVYSRPPLIEALCLFRFEPEQEWDLTIPGLLYDRIKADFPVRRRQHGIEVEIGLDDAGSVKRHSLSRMQFVRSDETALVQVGPNILIVNVLRPYPGWETFRAVILAVLEQYQEVATPKTIQSASLRYINRLDFNAGIVDIEEFLRFYPSVPEPIPQEFASWAQTVEALLSFGILRIRAGSKSLDDDALAFALDIEVVSSPVGSGAESISAWMEEAHQHIEGTFEACITDSARSLFEEVPYEHTSVR